MLTIRRAVRGDSGKYTLVITNSSGSTEKDAEVIVLGIVFVLNKYTYHNMCQN